MNGSFAWRYLASLVGVFVSIAIALSVAGAFLGFWAVMTRGYVPFLVVILLLLVSAVLAHLQTVGTCIADMTKAKDDAIEQAATIAAQREAIRKESEVWKSSLKEKSKGFPTLVSAIQEYESLQDEGLVNFLKQKRHPAIRASEIVSEYSRRRREAEHNAKVIRSILEYYENMAPFLIDLKNDIYEDDKAAFSYQYSDEENEDPVIRYVSKDEYRRLSSTERNQLALDRYWQRPKSRVHIGRVYERFIGYLHERDGWAVDYTGIFKGYEDLGRDLICHKDDRTIIVQCKYWSQFKTIYEKHIFQFFGTVFQFKDEWKDSSVQAHFYTTTKVSDLSRRFARELGIVLKEEFAFDPQYPCIKCNISPATKEKIYHLPFDQQYDTTKICRPGELYCRSVAEAEGWGFRRAMRWRGDKGG
ncbi:MAG: restriction endonuclease [Deltaproteobacteria bacterium]|nr:restriction endonuclease [Deltaproteobacteria bacterium]